MHIRKQIVFFKNKFCCNCPWSLFLASKMYATVLTNTASIVPQSVTMDTGAAVTAQRVVTILVTLRTALNTLIHIYNTSPWQPITYISPWKHSWSHSALPSTLIHIYNTSPWQPITHHHGNQLHTYHHRNTPGHTPHCPSHTHPHLQHSAMATNYKSTWIYQSYSSVRSLPFNMRRSINFSWTKRCNSFEMCRQRVGTICQAIMEDMYFISLLHQGWN